MEKFTKKKRSLREKNGAMEESLTGRFPLIDFILGTKKIF